VNLFIVHCGVHVVGVVVCVCVWVGVNVLCSPSVQCPCCSSIYIQYSVHALTLVTIYLFLLLRSLFAHPICVYCSNHINLNRYRRVCILECPLRSRPPPLLCRQTRPSQTSRVRRGRGRGGQGGRRHGRHRSNHRRCTYQIKSSVDHIQVVLQSGVAMNPPCTAHWTLDTGNISMVLFH